MLAREFDSVTPENEMKWAVVEPNRGQFNWWGADAIVNRGVALTPGFSGVAFLLRIRRASISGLRGRVRGAVVARPLGGKRSHAPVNARGSASWRGACGLDAANPVSRAARRCLN